MTTWHARTASGLDVINGVIHDAWFDADDIDHDMGAGTLVIPFAQDWRQVADGGAPEWTRAPRSEVVAVTWRYREERVPFMQGVLRVAHVRDIQRDDAIADAGTLLRLGYDEAASRLTVDGLSGTLVVAVVGLDVACELSRDEVALFVRRRHNRLLRSTSEVPLWNSEPDFAPDT